MRVCMDRVEIGNREKREWNRLKREKAREFGISEGVRYARQNETEDARNAEKVK